MFWIGFIVGIVTVIVVSFVFVAWCFGVCGINWSEFRQLSHANAVAFENRESRIEVWHDDEVLETVTLEER